MDQSDRGIPLAAHARGEAQRSAVVVRTAVPDTDDDAIRCPLVAIRLPALRLTIDRVGTSTHLRVVDHLSTSSAAKTPRPMIAPARSSEA